MLTLAASRLSMTALEKKTPPGQNGGERGWKRKWHMERKIKHKPPAVCQLKGEPFIVVLFKRAIGTDF